MYWAKESMARSEGSVVERKKKHVSLRQTALKNRALRKNVDGVNVKGEVKMRLSDKMEEGTPGVDGSVEERLLGRVD